MSSTITVNSNFPEILSSDVEYTVSFQIISEERIDSILKYKFSDDTIIKRISKTEEYNSFFYTDTTITFILSGVGSFYFTLELNEDVIYQKKFILEKILDYPTNKESEITSQCFLCPENVSYEEENNDITFLCKHVSNNVWIDYYLNHNIKNNKKIYCGIRYYAPDLSTHWKIVTKSEYGIQDSGYVEFTHIDGNQVDWYFPIANFIDDTFKICEKEYIQSVRFYKLVGSEYVELCYKDYYIKIITETSSIEWTEEIISLLEYVFKGYSTENLIFCYCERHHINDEKAKELISTFKNNFGEFALKYNLIQTKQQKILLNYLTNYELLDNIIESGGTDLLKIRKDLTTFIKRFYNKII